MCYCVPSDKHFKWCRCWGRGMEMRHKLEWQQLNTYDAWNPMDPPKAREADRLITLLVTSIIYILRTLHAVLWVHLDRQFITSKERWSIQTHIQWLKWYFGHLTPFILYWSFKGVELQFISHKKKCLCHCRCQFQSKLISHYRTWITWKVYIFNMLNISWALVTHWPSSQIVSLIIQT